MNGTIDMGIAQQRCASEQSGEQNLQFHQPVSYIGLIRLHKLMFHS